MTKTVDKELDERIESLHDLQNRYLQVLTNANLFLAHFNASSHAERALADSIYQLSVKEDSLKVSL